MKKILEWALGRLAEKTTWASIFVLLVTYFGVQISPELQAEITQTGLGIVGIILIALKEKK